MADTSTGGDWCCCPTCYQYDDIFYDRTLLCGRDVDRNPEPCMATADCTCLDGVPCDPSGAPHRCPNPNVNPTCDEQPWDQKHATGDWWIVPISAPYPNSDPEGALAEISGNGRIMLSVGFPGRGNGVQVTVGHEYPGQHWKLHVGCSREDPDGGIVAEIYTGAYTGANNNCWVKLGDRIKYFTLQDVGVGGHTYKLDYDQDNGVVCFWYPTGNLIRSFKLSATGYKASLENLSGIVDGYPMPISWTRVLYYGKYRYPNQWETERRCLGCVCTCQQDEDGELVDYPLRKTLHLVVSGHCNDRVCGPVSCLTVGTRVILLETDLILLAALEEQEEADYPQNDQWVHVGALDLCLGKAQFALHCMGVLDMTTWFAESPYGPNYAYNTRHLIADEIQCHPFKWVTDYDFSQVPGGNLYTDALWSCCGLPCGGAAGCYNRGTIHVEITEVDGDYEP